MRFNMELLTFRRVVWAVVALLGLIGIVTGVLYLATHGRITVSSEGRVYSMRYCGADCTSSEEISGSSATLPTGEYAVLVKMDNNTSYIANVRVNGFLQTTTIAPKSKKYSPSVVATSTNQYILPVGSGILTYDPDGSAYVTPSSKDLGVSKLAAAQYVNNQDLLLVEYSEPIADVAQPEKVILYNSSLGSSTVVGTVSGIQASDILHGGGSSLQAARQDNNGYTVLRISAAGITEAKIPASINYARNNDAPIAASSGTSYAFIAGNDYAPNDSGESVTPTLNDEVLSLYDASFNKLRDIQLGKRRDISSVSFSPNAKVLAVIGESSVSVYDTSTGDIVFKTLANNTSNQPIIWQDDNTFVYQVGSGGVYLADLKNKESYSIVDNSLLRITALSSMRDNKVYLTAFPNKAGNSDHTSPDGYMIDLSQDASGVEAVSGDSIVRELPYVGSTYTIGYHYENGSKLIIDVNAEAGARNSAIVKIIDLGFDPGDLTIRFVNYSNSFATNRGAAQ